MAVFAHEHEAQAEHGFAAAVGRHGSQADFVAGLHVRHVADADRHAVLGGDHDVLDLLQVDRAALAVDQQHPRPDGDAPAADVAVVLLDGLHNLVERQAVLDQPLRVDADLVLLFVAAPAVDLGHAGNGPKLRLDDPVVNGPQLGELLDPLLLRQLEKSYPS